MENTALAIVSPSPEPLDRPRLVERAQHFADRSRARRTREAYAEDWACFVAFCTAAGLEPFPASVATVIAFAVALADTGRKPSTIGRRLAGVGFQHRQRRVADPCSDPGAREVMRGIRREAVERGVRTRQAAALLPADMLAIVDELPKGRRGTLWRAILLLGWAGALRRSELCALDLADVVFVEGGAELALRHSKTDQEGAGHTLAIAFGRRAATCPVRALRAWVELRGSEPGPLFPGRRDGRWTGEGVNLLVKRAARAAGLEGDVSAHSLRRGCVTAAIRAGRRVDEVRAHSRHASLTAFAAYVEAESRWSAPLQLL